MKMRTVLETTLPADAAAVSAARHALDALRDQVSEGLLADLRLAVSELVTNSVRHGRSGAVADDVELAVRMDGQALRLEICDCGQGFVPRRVDREADLDALGGRGLFIVEQLAERWGVTRAGKSCVWADFKRESTSP
jgi:anti-sigma regulatory factor (Ser/Thr protein kinase)